MGQNGLNWGPGGLKWHQHDLKQARVGSNGVKPHSEGAKGRQNPLKMASQTPKGPVQGKIRLSPQPGGYPQHSGRGALGNGTAQRRLLMLESRFLPKSVHMGWGVPYVHMGGGSHMYIWEGGPIWYQQFENLALYIRYPVHLGSYI